jgi:hypothetical protein
MYIRIWLEFMWSLKAEETRCVIIKTLYGVVH